MNISRDDFNKSITHNFLRKVDKKLYFDKINDKNAFRDAVFATLENNTYFPKTPSLLLSCNKGKGVLRFVPILSKEDNIVYSFCISIIDEYLTSHKVESTYGGWQMSCAMRRKEKEFDEIVAIENPSPCSNTFNKNAYIEQFGEFNSRIKDMSQFADENKLAVVSLDIANYYNRIRLDLLEDNVRGVVPIEKKEVVNCLMFFLRNWDRSINSFLPQSVGIPQEYFGDCSRILANFYLQSYDAAMKEHIESMGGKYFRFADDQVLFVPKAIKEEAVAYASTQLMLLGLDINVSKVLVFENIASYFEYKGVAMLDELVTGIKMREQSVENIEKLIKGFISTDREKILKNGSHILKTIVHLGLERIDVDIKDIIFDILVNEYLDLDYDERMTKELKTALSESQWQKFTKEYSDSIRREVQSVRRFNALKNKILMDEKDFNWLNIDTILEVQSQYINTCQG